MAIEYPNGVRTHYGPQDVGKKEPAYLSTYGAINQLVVPVNYDDLPSAHETDAIIDVIPANSFIVSSRFYVETDFDSTSGTTTLDIGLQQTDGTEIDNDGFDDDAVTADGSNAGWVAGDGALVGASIGAVGGQIVVTPSVDDLEAGKGYIVVEYIVPPGI